MKSACDRELAKGLPPGGRPPVRLKWFLVRLIFLCLLPAVGVAAAFGVYQVLFQYDEINEAADTLARGYQVSVGHDVDTRIRGLSMLAESSLILADERLGELYELAQAYRENFGSHVILADPKPPMSMLFNTRVPLGEPLPPLPVPEEFAAAPAAVSGRRPTVGDVFFGPIVKRDLVAIAVPVVHDGAVVRLLLALVGTQEFQGRIDEVVVSDDWALSLVDSRGTVIARNGAQAAEDDAARRIALAVESSPWHVVLSIAPRAYWLPLAQSSAFLLMLVAVALLVGLAGGSVSARRLEREAAAMASPKVRREVAPRIVEFARAAAAIDQAGDALEARAASLVKQDERLRLAHRLAGIGFWEWESGTDRFRGAPESELLVSGRPQPFEGTLEQWCARIHEDDRQLVVEAFRRPGAGQSSIDLEFRVEHLGAGTRWLVLLGHRGDVSGAPGTYLGVIMDDTEKRRYVDSLRQVEKMQAVGQMASGIAHDFNNVLGIILGNVTLLRKSGTDRLGGKPAERIEAIEQSTRRAIDLTANLLRFSRRDTANAVVVDVNEVVAGLDRLLGKSLTPAVELDLRLGRNLGPVEVDPGELGDALINLAVNARDAMPEGGRITVTTESASLDEDDCRVIPGIAPGDYVRISISDTGTGIPRELQECIFEPFFSTKPAGKGTGLGLAMVYAFVTRARGHIAVESEPGAGSTFRLWLPKVDRAAVATTAPEVEPAGMQVGDEAVLAVDDEPELLELAAEILRSLGYRVITASTAAQALEHLRSDSAIDLLFSDIVLPGGMNGFVLARQARELRPGLRVLLTSGDVKYQGEAAQAEVDVFEVLKKPYGDRDLALAVRRVLDGREPAAAGSLPSGWDPQLLIGIDAIDRDHHSLFDIVRRSREALARAAPAAEIVALLVELRDYAQTHFRREEAMMQVCDYPRPDEHHAAHEEFIERLADLDARIRRNPASANALVPFVSQWLTQHVHREVGEFRPLCARHRERIVRRLDQLEAEVDHRA